MMYRCYNPKRRNYDIYGGRGIIVCKEWHSFLNFYTDMAPTHFDGASIDRINTNGNYEPKNCRWATSLQQGNNTRRNRLFTFKNETLTISEWSKRIGIKQSIIYDRINKLGWSVEEALRKPKIPNGGSVNRRRATQTIALS